MKYLVTVKGTSGAQLRYEIEADNPGTALQVAATRDRELAKMDKFVKGPS